VAPLDITHTEGDNITMLGEYGTHSAPASLAAGLGNQDNFNMLSLSDNYINANDHQLPVDDDVHQHGPAHHQSSGTPTITSEVQYPPPSSKHLLLPKPAPVPAPWTSGQKSKAKPAAPTAPPCHSSQTTKPNPAYLNKDEWEVNNHHHHAIITTTTWPTSAAPNSYQEALKLANTRHWITAMKAKYASIIQNENISSHVSTPWSLHN
jgi:hypothetical protein